MKEPYDSDVQFKLHAEPDADEPTVFPQVDELQFDKLNHRVSLITILIPLLIIIVLAIAYFDIKKRMTHSEDTGLMEFKKLSADLESRFSSLSLRQAALEEGFIKLTQEQSQAKATIAGLNTQLAELDESLSQLQKNSTTFITQKEFNASRESITKHVNEVAQTVTRMEETVDKADNEIETMTREIKTQIEKMSASLNGRNDQFDQLQLRLNQQMERLNKIDRSLTQLESTKIEKSDVDLALRLENLKIEQTLKARLETLQNAINAMEGKIAKQVPPPKASLVEPSSKPMPTPSGSQKNTTVQSQQTRTGGTVSNGIEEQTIGQ